MLDELFGHKKHSFTGAHAARLGKIASADRGTLLLDEIADMSFAAQSALLRFLDSGEIAPIGEDRRRLVDVRVISATNRDLPKLVAQGKFRADLYDRLRVFEIEIPPLRMRREDIPALAAHFLRECCKHAGCALAKRNGERCSHAGGVDCATEAFLQGLQKYSWPGNVRELKMMIIRLRSRHREEVLDERHLPPEIRLAEAERADNVDSCDDLSLRASTRRHIERILRKNGHNLSATARNLDIPRSTLRHLVKKHGIVVSR